MAEVNTDSYPKPAALPAQKSLLDNVNQFQTTESNQLTIGKQKLDLMNSHFQIMNAELANLADDPNATPQVAMDRLNKIADTLGTPAPVRQQMLSEYSTLQTPQQVNQQAKLSLMRGMAMQDKINKVYGVNGYVNNGQSLTPTITRTGEGPRTVGDPIQLQQPPTQEENNPLTGQRQYRGPQPAVAAPGTVTAPPALPVARPAMAPPGPINNPAIQGNSSGLGGKVTGATADAPTFNDRYGATGLPTGGFAAPSPLFEEGKAQLSKDQSEATARMMRIKPALQALPLMQSKGFMSGPGSEQFTKAVAAMKTFGLINTANENDPTAIRQEVTKKLAQYVQGNPVGQRSDAAQILAEASNPNPKEHILPALMKLTKDAVALDRVQASIPNVFTASGEKDLSKYKPYAAKFPQSIDERAFTLDLEPEETSTSLVDGMAKKLKSSNKKDQAEADKFFRSLAIAKGQGFYQ